MPKFFIASVSQYTTTVDEKPWVSLGAMIKHLVPQFGPDEQQSPMLIPAWLDAREIPYHFEWTVKTSIEANPDGDGGKVVTSYYVVVERDEDAVLLKLFFDELKHEANEVPLSSMNTRAMWMSPVSTRYQYQVCRANV